jgi:hypothetical protein
VAVDDDYIFANRLKDLCQRQFAAQGIAIGADVAGEDKSVMIVHNSNQGGPFNGHADTF